MVGAPKHCAPATTGALRRIFNPFLSAVLVTALLLPCAASAQTLQETLAQVYASNPDIRAERFRLRAAAELPRQARAAVAPRLDGQVSLSEVDNTQLSTAGLFDPDEPVEREVDLDSTSFSVNYEQTLFSGFRNYHALQQARSRLLAGGAEVRVVEQRVLLTAVTAYVDVVRDMRVYSASESNVTTLLERRRDAKIRFELGEVTRTDVMQADARLASGQAQMSAAKRQLSVSRAEFMRVVGRMPGTLDREPAIPALPSSVEEAVTVALSYSPVLKLAGQTEAASRRQVAIANAARFPTVNLVASYTQADEPSPFLLEDERLAYGVTVNVPLFRGGATSSQVREAKALNASDRSRVVSARRAVEAEVYRAWERFIESRALINAAEAEEAATRSALEGVRREAQAGARTTLEVLDAEQEYLNAQVSIATALREEVVSAYELLAAMGTLTANPQTALLTSR